MSVPNFSSLAGLELAQVCGGGWVGWWGGGTGELSCVGFWQHYGTFYSKVNTTSTSINEDNLKDEDNLKNEDDLKTTKTTKNEDNLKSEDNI